MKIKKDILLLVQLLRIEDWIKNLLIFVPLIFTNQLFIIEELFIIIVSFFVFSLASSSVYLFNDIIDFKVDKLSNLKMQTKPIAREEVSISSAKKILLLLLFLTFLSLLIFVPVILFPVTLYLCLNIFYSAYLKRIIFIELLIISSFYVLRAYVGGVAISKEISIFLILMIFFTSLFVITIKRKKEFINKLFDIRKVLKKYTLNIFSYLITLSFSGIFVTYLIYLINKEQNIFLNLPLVSTILLRYYLINKKDNKIISPSIIVLKDLLLILLVFIWLTLNIFEIYILRI